MVKELKISEDNCFFYKFYYEGKELRILLDDENKIWFSISDVCNILNINKIRNLIKNISTALRRYHLCYETKEDGTTMKIMMNFTLESGLYEAFSESKNVEIRKFMRWVYKDLIVYVERNILEIERCGYDKDILFYVIKKFDTRLAK